MKTFSPFKIKKYKPFKLKIRKKRSRGRALHLFCFGQSYVRTARSESDIERNVKLLATLSALVTGQVTVSEIDCSAIYVSSVHLTIVII